VHPVGKKHMSSEPPWPSGQSLQGLPAHPLRLVLKQPASGLRDTTHVGGKTCTCSPVQVCDSVAVLVISGSLQSVERVKKWPLALRGKEVSPSNGMSQAP